MPDEILLPCPFCGHAAEISGSVESGFGMAIICPHCAGQRFFVHDLAVSHWNHRALAEALKPSHNSDYAAALIRILYNHFPKEESRVVLQIVDDVQRLNASRFA